ncbi:MAG: AbrB/MazE/SpoVT family DNA-binding domain-containing protein [Deltaproteobacteria bacterium]|nr:AbrB/MazE/SpoVT family DNA-binding domain-containing protein [Deltaproteobacteria bacterium]
MSKVTSKLQVTLPKVVAEQLGIRPGDQIDWEIAGEALRVIPVSKRRHEKKALQARLQFFDQATRRQRKRESAIDPALLHTKQTGRGWTREDLYSRGGTG